MKYCRIENNIVVEIFPYNPFEWIQNEAFLNNCMECPDLVEEGYVYKNNTFINPLIKTQSEKRKEAYATDTLITWESEKITVDEANKIYMEYFAEENEKATLIQPLIREAKNTIRNQYPD